MFFWVMLLTLCLYFLLFESSFFVSFYLLSSCLSFRNNLNFHASTNVIFNFAKLISSFFVSQDKEADSLCYLSFCEKCYFSIFTLVFQVVHLVLKKFNVRNPWVKVICWARFVIWFQHWLAFLWNILES